jgi:ubiquinone/menaquinone biosynthesis C-methylase UbiE
MNKELQTGRQDWENLAEIQRFENARAATDLAFRENIAQICHDVLPPTGTILDLGAGGGALLQRMPEVFRNRVVQLDISQNYMAFLKASNPDAKPLVADATVLPFKDNTFEAIISLSTLHTIPDAEKAISEVKRVLKPGGTFTHILDIVPIPEPMIEYIKKEKKFIFPAEDVVDTLGIPHPAYQTPTMQEVLQFLKTNQIEKSLMNMIAITLQHPDPSLRGFATNPEINNGFIEDLQEIKFPGEIVPMTTLFQRRLVDHLTAENFADIQAGTDQAQKIIDRTTPFMIDATGLPTNATITSQGVRANAFTPSVPVDKYLLYSIVQTVTARKAA